MLICHEFVDDLLDGDEMRRAGCGFSSFHRHTFLEPVLVSCHTRMPSILILSPSFETTARILESIKSRSPFFVWSRSLKLSGTFA